MLSVGRTHRAVKRREFIILLGGMAAARPLRANAQPANKIKVGFLHPGPAVAVSSRIEALLGGLRTSGYSEEQVEVIWRAAEGDPGLLAAMAAELLHQGVVVVIAVTIAAVRALQAADPAIPILAQDLETDPVAAGLVKSYQNPGGNVTGVFFDFPEFREKWLELLEEAIPNLSTIALLWDPATGPAQLKEMEAPSAQHRLKSLTLEVRTITELNDALSHAKRQAVGAVLVLSSPLWGTRPEVLADLTLRHQLPAVTLFPDFARNGGLMAYGPIILDTYRPLGVLLGKVLRGEKVGNLPVERPAKFELVVNLTTAKLLGISIPAPILLRADEVIE
jgi:putative tryptophan/tyrosine transport system substrate-binding protein